MKPTSRFRIRARCEQVEVVDRRIVQDIGSARRRIEKAEDRQERRFAAAGRTGDGHILALLEIEMDARESVCLHLVGVEDFS